MRETETVYQIQTNDQPKSDWHGLCFATREDADKMVDDILAWKGAIADGFKPEHFTVVRVTRTVR